MEFNEEQDRLLRGIMQKVKKDQEPTDNEVSLFKQACIAKDLNPFTQQICVQYRWNKKQARWDMAIIIQIHGLRTIADRTGSYSPGDQTVFYQEEGEKFPQYATAYVKKKAGGDWHVVAESAYWAEFKPEFGDYMWLRMPHVMLGKCAEALSLRRAFPSEMSGLYVPEEMDQAGPHAAQGPVTEDAKLDTKADAQEWADKLVSGVRSEPRKASVPTTYEMLGVPDKEVEQLTEVWVTRMKKAGSEIELNKAAEEMKGDKAYKHFKEDALAVLRDAYTDHLAVVREEDSKQGELAWQE